MVLGRLLLWNFCSFFSIHTIIYHYHILSLSLLLSFSHTYLLFFFWCSSVVLNGFQPTPLLTQQSTITSPSPHNPSIWHRPPTRCLEDTATTGKATNRCFIRPSPIDIVNESHYGWLFPKIVGKLPPNHPLKNRVWNHDFHHPFWGIFGNTHYLRRVS